MKTPQIRKFQTLSGIELKDYYLPPDVNMDYKEKLGNAGEFPFTRGIQPDMYRGKIWTMRQYAGFGTAEDTNKRFRYLYEHGQTGFSVAFDLPTQMGYDSDHFMARGEVGRVGVAIDSIEDVEVLFRGLPPGEISTSMTINATAGILLAMYVSVAEKQNVSSSLLRGTVQNDILKEYSARGTYIFPPEHSLRLTVDLIEFCSKNMPLWNPISISGYHMREAGATAVQEVAFTLADAIEYVSACIRRGLKVDDFAPRLSFFFACHNDFLEEIAKFRAARRLWAKIMKERFGTKNPRSMILRFHTQTSGCTLTAQQPLNNAVRVALQALAAVLGGTQSLHTNSYDEALALPTEDAVRLALRTQQIIAEESGVINTVDPVGGAYAIEYLTDEIERRVMDELNKIDELGGAVKAIESGYIQKAISDSAYRYQQEIESKMRKIVGVNAFIIDEKKKFKRLKIDPEVEKRQVFKLKRFKLKRDNRKIAKVLDMVKKAGEGGENIMPSILTAVKSGATVGEISDALRNIFGTYQDKTT
jgi:methylmalonyl-CoA mutase N-terminal domain/subunit